MLVMPIHIGGAGRLATGRSPRSFDSTHPKTPPARRSRSREQHLRGDNYLDTHRAGGQRCSTGPLDRCGSGAQSVAGSPGGSTTSTPSSSSDDRDRSDCRSGRACDSARRGTPGALPTSSFSGHQGLDERTGHARESRETPQAAHADPVRVWEARQVAHLRRRASACTGRVVAKRRCTDAHTPSPSNSAGEHLAAVARNQIHGLVPVSGTRTTVSPNPAAV